jgi:hypothetical protein
MSVGKQFPIETLDGYVTLDLTPLAMGVSRIKASLTLTDIESPDLLEFEIVSSHPTINRYFFEKLPLTSVIVNDQIVVQLNDGRTVEANIAFVANRSKSSQGLKLRVYLTCVKVSRIGCAEPKIWQFMIANVRLKPLDSVQDISPPESVLNYLAINGFPNAETKAIRLSFGNRSWQLVEFLHRDWPPEYQRIYTPINSAVLITEVGYNDNIQDLQRCATTLCLLLSFALGRDINWSSQSQLDENGHAIVEVQQKPGIRAFKEKSFRLVDDFGCNNLSTFLEVAYPTFCSDQEWWHITIDLLVDARCAGVLESKCAILNILLERIADHELEASDNEIHRDLEKSLSEEGFKADLQKCLNKLPGWKQERTNAVLQTIKEWNKRPSLAAKVKRICSKLGMHEPSGKRIRFRNGLLHRGEFDSSLKAFADQLEYLHEVEAVVCLLLVRMLKFEGFIYLNALGYSDGITVADAIKFLNRPEDVVSIRTKVEFDMLNRDANKLQQTIGNQQDAALVKEDINTTEVNY